MYSWDTLHAFTDEMEKISSVASTVGGSALGALLGAAGGATTAEPGERRSGALRGALAGAGVGALGGYAGGRVLGGHKKTLQRIGEAEFKARGSIPAPAVAPKRGFMDKVLGRPVKALPEGTPVGEYTPLHGPKSKTLQKLHQMRTGAEASIKPKMVAIGAAGGLGSLGAGRFAGGTGQPQPVDYQP